MSRYRKSRIVLAFASTAVLGSGANASAPILVNPGISGPIRTVGVVAPIPGNPGMSGRQPSQGASPHGGSLAFHRIKLCPTWGCSGPPWMHHH